MNREILVVSDLHLGSTTTPISRLVEKKLTTFIESLIHKSLKIELVINGDFIDFLTVKNAAGAWMPFRHEIDDIIVAIKSVMASNIEIFAALNTFLAHGNQLTILLGNHDLELSLPAVRHYLKKTVFGGNRGIDLIYDGEAYVVGDALIEHGNRYDKFNVVNFDSLRQLRSNLSRRGEVNPNVVVAPPGSYLVTEIINKIKVNHPFVDLIKPESTAVIPFLLAIAPEYKRDIISVLKRGYEANLNEYKGGMPVYVGNLASRNTAVPNMKDALREVLTDELYEETCRMFPGIFEQTFIIGETSSSISIFEKALGYAGLITGNNNLHFLKLCIASLSTDDSFSLEQEGHKGTADAATTLIKQGFKYVIFGHTHLKKDMKILDGRYFNCGSWHPYLNIKKEVISDGEIDTTKLLNFLEKLKAGQISEMLEIPGTYVKLLLNESSGKVMEAQLVEA